MAKESPSTVIPTKTRESPLLNGHHVLMLPRVGRLHLKFSQCLTFTLDERDDHTVSKNAHTPDIAQRRGPNPLKTWLKGD